MNELHNESLQGLCRDYLKKLRGLARKHGLYDYVTSMISANKKGECECTESECRLLSRMVNDERVQRVDVPKIIGKSYRECNENGVFDKIKKLKRVGVYSKVSAILFKNKIKKNKI